MSQASLFPAEEIQRDAAVSPCGCYRWSLSRVWNPNLLKPWVGWIMLNPSTADASFDDPTIRKCMAFSRAWGYGGMTVRNLFCLRATQPQDMLAADHPNGPPEQLSQVDRTLAGLAVGCQLIIAAWGVNGSHRGRDREVYKLFEAIDVKLHCLRLTKDGHPEHPLYLPLDLKPVEFTMRGV